MFKSILKSLFALVALVSIFSAPVSAQDYGSNLELVLRDPYTCGGNITGSVTGGYGSIDVIITLFDVDGYEVAEYNVYDLESGDKYYVSRPDLDVDPGMYDVFAIAVDSMGNTDTVEFKADIKAPEDCPTMVLLRSGAANFVRDNVVLLGFGTLAMASVAVLFSRNRKALIER